MFSFASWRAGRGWSEMAAAAMRKTQLGDIRCWICRYWMTERTTLNQQFTFCKGSKQAAAAMQGGEAKEKEIISAIPFNTLVLLMFIRNECTLLEMGYFLDLDFSQYLSPSLPRVLLSYATSHPPPLTLSAGVCQSTAAPSCLPDIRVTSPGCVGHHQHWWWLKLDKIYWMRSAKIIYY